MEITTSTNANKRFLLLLCCDLHIISKSKIIYFMKIKYALRKIRINSNEFFLYFLRHDPPYDFQNIRLNFNL